MNRIIGKWVHRLAALVLGGLMAATAQAYPIDGYATTGMRRLQAAQLIQEGVIEGRKQPPGALRSLAEVDLRLLQARDLQLPAPDPALSRSLVSLLGDRADDYQLALLDLSDPQRPRFAAHREEVSQNVGSVGKLLVALGVFQALADVYPDDLQARAAWLRQTRIVADEFIQTDHHEVVLWDPARRTLTKRLLSVGDVGSPWDFLDWALSASSNAAASVLIANSMLLKHFGARYPVSLEEAAGFFAATPRAELGRLFAQVLQEPVIRNGMDLARFRQGSFFTKTGNRKVPGTTSYATPVALIDYLVRMEKGLLVDEFSSREIKRLLYATERRIRYASSRALRDSAVYFKSGSLYQCKPEPGYRCLKYRGNVKNFMNSVAIVESTFEGRRIHYLVALLSNVLRRNSAVDHQTLATGIHELMTTGVISKATALARTEEELARAGALEPAE